MPSKTTLAYEFVRKPLAVIKTLLAENPHMIAERDEANRFLLHWAAIAGREELCAYILERFPEQSDAEDNFKMTPVILAALKGHLPIVTKIVQSGANINHRNRGGHSALQYACSTGKLHIANYLIEAGADVNITDALGETPLHRAASQGHFHIVETLLLHGANPNTANKEGNTPLHLACEENDQTSALLLLKRGANRTLLNGEGKTPFALASRLILVFDSQNKTQKTKNNKTKK